MSHVSIYHNLLWPRYKGAVFSELHALAQAKGRGVDFVQIAETDSERAALSGVDLRYHRYPYELLFKGAYEAAGGWQRVWTLVRHVRRSDARLVVLPGYHRIEYWSMLLMCMLLGKQRAVFCDSTARDRPPHPLKRVAKRLFFAACDGFFAYGQRSAEYLRENGARSDRIFQPCQAAASPIGFDAAAALVRRIAARAAETAPRFLFVGRLSPEKGLSSLLQAFAAFRAAHGSGHLVLVGAGPLRAALQAQAATLGLAAHGELTGAMGADELAAQYARATCLVLPSTSEPWGLVANEALEQGCPVLVSDACGCRPELVREGLTGFAFPAGDVAALLDAMTHAVPAFADAAAVGRVCQQHITTYSPRAAASRILAGCEVLLDARG